MAEGETWGLTGQKAEKDVGRERAAIFSYIVAIAYIRCQLTKTLHCVLLTNS